MSNTSGITPVRNRTEYSANYYKKNAEKKRAYSKLWALENKEKHLVSVKEWKKNNPEKDKEYKRATRLKREFGISLEEYNQRFNSQEGCCLICGAHQTSLKKALAVDHCHTTGKIRGLLCSSCNLNLGIYEKYNTIFNTYLKGDNHE